MVEEKVKRYLLEQTQRALEKAAAPLIDLGLLPEGTTFHVEARLPGKVDAAKVTIGLAAPSVGGTLIDVAAEHPAIALLREVEWHLGSRVAACPVCGNEKIDGHAPGCRLAALIAPEAPEAEDNEARGGAR